MVSEEGEMHQTAVAAITEEHKQLRHWLLRHELREHCRHGQWWHPDDARQRMAIAQSAQRAWKMQMARGNVGRACSSRRQEWQLAGNMLRVLRERECFTKA